MYVDWNGNEQEDLEGQAMRRDAREQEQPENSFEQKLTTLVRTIEYALEQANRVKAADWNEVLSQVVSIEFALETATEHASDLDEMLRRKIAEG